MTDKLKPCPACDSTKIGRRFDHPGDYGDGYFYQCGSCGVRGPAHINKRRCFELWQLMPRRQDTADDDALKREVYGHYWDLIYASDLDSAGMMHHYRKRMEAAGWYRAGDEQQQEGDE